MPPADELIQELYRELRQTADRLLSRRRPSRFTLQPTALVHEVYLRLASSGEADRYRSPTHFQAVAAQAMRHVMIDLHRGATRDKRGGERLRVTLHDEACAIAEGDPAFEVLHRALEKLGDLDPRAAQGVELRFFGGLSSAEIAEEMQVSERTIRNDWAMARTWLKARMQADSDPEPEPAP